MPIRQTENHLEIGVRHYFLRFLCLVLFITSVAGFNNPKQPDGTAIGVGFLAAAIILLLMTRSVTIELDRPSDRFSVRYGGIVFGIRRKIIERPLHELRSAITQTSTPSGLTYTSRGRASRLVFVLTTEEKIPLTRFFSGGDMGEHHQIEHAINDFLKHHQ